MALYDNDGNIRVTEADGSARGRYAPDGSWYVNIDSGNKGLYGDNGCLNVKTWDGTYSVYNPDGGMWTYEGVLVSGNVLNRNELSLNALMAAQADGFWFDFSKTDRFFQENTGQTLADDVGEAIGLALSQRAWDGKTLAEVLAAATELVSGAWSMSVAGGTSTATESPAGTLNLTGDGTNAARGDMQVATVVGSTYVMEFDAATNTAFVTVGSGAGGTQALAATTINIGTAKRIAFVAVSTTSHIRVARIGAGLSTVSDISCKLIPGKHGVQATGTLKPVRQTDGAKFDGSDDNLLTNYLAGVGANFIVAKVTVPASLASTRWFAGSYDGGSGRFILGFNTSGQVVGAVGAQNEATIKGTVNHLGGTAIVGLSFDGNTVRLFDVGSLVYEGAQSGTPNTTIPVRLGSLNNNGTAGSFFGGAIEEIVAGREFLTLARFNQIASQL